MKEIGGYLELERNYGPSLHEGCVALNCGRACLAYLIEAREIHAIWLPDFLCDSVLNQCIALNVEVKRYAIAENLEPSYDFVVAEGEWLYVVDYYGRLTEVQFERAHEHARGRVIVDEAQAYYREPRPGVDTIYTCRKFFGVPDGGYLSTTARLDRELPRSESREHVEFLIGRLERSANEFFAQSQENNRRFATVPLARMSKFTENQLHGIDYDWVRLERERNFAVLAEALGNVNRLDPDYPVAPYAYPLLTANAPALRSALAKRHIYVATLWPNVLSECASDTVAFRYAQGILPLPVDQRYDENDMRTILLALKEEGLQWT